MFKLFGSGADGHEPTPTLSVKCRSLVRATAKPLGSDHSLGVCSISWSHAKVSDLLSEQWRILQRWVCNEYFEH
jgi:hypothetical protein